MTYDTPLGPSALFFRRDSIKSTRTVAKKQPNPPKIDPGDHHFSLVV
jgi:hypothetical protein